MDSGGQGGVYNETVYRPKEQKQGLRKPANRRILIGIVVLLAVILLIIIIAVAVSKGKKPQQALILYPEGKGNLIHVDTSQPEANDKYINSLKGLLAGYKTQAEAHRNDLYDCADKDSQLPNHQAACLFNVSQLETRYGGEKKFGYPEAQPVIILQIKAPQNWKPQLYNNETINDVPDSHKLSRRLPVDYIPVSCEPVSNPDIDNIGTIEVFPEYGFHAKYFPFTGQEAYQPPLVAVQFKNLFSGVVVAVRCKAHDPSLSQDEAKMFETTIYLEVN